VSGYCGAIEIRAGNEDWDFWIEAANLGFSAAHVSRPLYFYRRRALDKRIVVSVIGVVRRPDPSLNAGVSVYDENN
jgi:hypothetical protein